MQKDIVFLIQKSLESLSISQDLHNDIVKKISLEVSENSQYGDFSSTIAMQLTKILKKNPLDIAQNIIKQIPKNEIIEKIEIAGPGFLNFFVFPRVYNKMLQKIALLGENYGKNEILKDKLFIAEHTDPNLFKEIHVGHIMTNTIGESLYRIAKFSGATVKNVTFQGDVGLHIAKALWGIQKREKDFPFDKSPYEKQKFLGECYVLGEKYFSQEMKNEKENSAKIEILDINKKIYEIVKDPKKFPQLSQIYTLGKKLSLEYLESIYKILGSQFDHYFLESSTFEDGQRIVEENAEDKGKKVFVKSKNSNAIIFEGEKYGFHTRVFINSEGLPTYEAKDIGLFYAKWKKYNPDISLTVTGGDQDVYFKTVREAGGLINPEWKEKTVHIAHGTLKLSTGKMSSRTGKIVRAQEWIDSAKMHLLEKMKGRDIEPSQQKAIAQKIAIGAIKYAIIKVSVGKDIVYDPDTALDFTGNSGPYLQYSYVRAQSILNKVKNYSYLESEIDFVDDNSPISSFQKILNIFPSVVEKSLKNYSSHYIANYLYEVAKEFNSFYSHTKILDKKNPHYKKNIVLVQVFSHIMKNGLYLLGIQTVEKM